MQWVSSFLMANQHSAQKIDVNKIWIWSNIWFPGTTGVHHHHHRHLFYSVAVDKCNNQEDQEAEQDTPGSDELLL